ncbi:uncharacterized protein LOC120353095 [Nilaparvata lugens]|uniref:uncharacterized protein LOC120353095 n=1 Tax=Nilaparvata lugens TaxID=108931 RepID=UPI00193E6F5C|nr:uncharacterized protein LOC120353095 [Nilaparvata lugens]
MVRTYERKTSRADISEENVKKAIHEVMKEKKTIRATAAKFGLTKSMLSKRLKALKAGESNDSETDNTPEKDVASSLKVKGKHKYHVHQVFFDDQEKMLQEYLTKASSMHYDLTYLQAQKFAYEYAK